MVKVVNCSWMKKEEEVDVESVKRGLRVLGERWFELLVRHEREDVLGWLKVKFSGLMMEDLEEVYDDGCLVLWGKVNEGLKLEKDSLVGYLKSACWRIAMHYLRGIRQIEVSLDEMMEGRYNKVEDEDDGTMIENVWDVMEDEETEEDKRMEKLDEVWEKLGEVDRMILESYYWDGMKMGEIARKIGYKTSDSVKSRKNKILKKIMEMMKEEGDVTESASHLVAFTPQMKLNVA